MPIEFIGMIGVRPEGADGAAVHVIGGEIDPAWVLAPTEEQAWDKARGILARVIAKQGDRTLPNPEAVGAQRLVDFARRAEVHDKRLWTPIAAAVAGAGNTTALVGTPEQVAESLLDYYDLGVTTLLIRGFDPLPDAAEYGRELIPLVRREVARRDRAAA